MLLQRHPGGGVERRAVDAAVADHQPHHGECPAVEVAPGPHLPGPVANGKLGRAVARGHRDGGELGLLGSFHGARGPKIDDDRVALAVHQHVLRFDVAVDQACGMNRAERGEELGCDRLPGGPVCARRGLVGKFDAIDEVHGEVGRSVFAPGCAHRHHTRTPESMEDLSLFLHLLYPDRHVVFAARQRHHGRAGTDHELVDGELLDDAAVVELLIPGQVGDGKATGAQQALHNEPCAAFGGRVRMEQVVG